MATACRKPDGDITIRAEAVPSLLLRHRWLNIPFVRGLPALIDTLRIGFSALFFSAEVQSEAEGGTPVQSWHLGLSLTVALTVVVVLFVWLPTGLGDWLLPKDATPFLRNLLETFVRLVLLLGYLLVISLMKNIQRVFQYHGAEHMAIHALEAGADLTPAGARPFPTLHPRCGTAFLVLVVLFGFVVHLAMGWPAPALRYALRIAAIPVIAGIAYEWIRLAGRAPHSAVLRVLNTPGLWAQYLTTRVPDDAQLEVAIASLRACMEAEREAASGPAAA